METPSIRKSFFVAGALLMLAASPVEAGGQPRIRNMVEKGSTGQFNCAYQGKPASKPCTVIVKEELVTHTDFVQFYGKAKRTAVLTIKWPDGDMEKPWIKFWRI